MPLLLLTISTVLLVLMAAEDSRVEREWMVLRLVRQARHHERRQQYLSRRCYGHGRW